MFAISPTSRQRLAELALGKTAIAMPAGPKWVCLLTGNAHGSLDGAQWQAITPLLAHIRPLDIALEPAQPAGGGLLACAAHNEAGQAQAYALLHADRSVEILATLRTGCWPPDYRAWWPGAYEKPLLEQLLSAYFPLATTLRLSPAALCMSLLDIGGTALIANNQLGTERAYPFSTGQNRLDLPPVVLDVEGNTTVDALINAFDQVRAHANVAMPHAFYL